jgi:predicted Ser/Thr protein kinase
VSQTPHDLTPEEKNELVGSLISIVNEYSETLFYEGRVGASPREIKNIILNSLQNPEFKCLSPFAIFHELNELTKKKSEYEFLNIEPRGQYHDVKLFLVIIQEYFLKLIEGEILNSLGFYNITDYEKFLNDYIMHVTHYVKKEKIRSQATRKAENPDETLMQSFEDQIGGVKDTDEFRKSILSTIGAFKIDNPEEDINNFKKVFPGYFKKLQEYNYNKHKEKIEKLKPELEEYLGKKGKGETNLDNILSDLVNTTIKNLVKNHNYCEHCAPEILYYFVKTKYSSAQTKS